MRFGLLGIVLSIWPVKADQSFEILGTPLNFYVDFVKVFNLNNILIINDYYGSGK